jgi:hypothetical protein
VAWWDFWPYTEHQDLTNRGITLAQERFPEMAQELATFRDQMVQGSHDEDYASNPRYGDAADYSAYCPSVPRAYWPIAQLPLNAPQWVGKKVNPNNWFAAVRVYESNRRNGYYKLGRILHNLEDVFVPAHVFVAPHGSGTEGLVENHSWPLYFDNFEQWCEVSQQTLSLANPDNIPTGLTDPFSFIVDAAEFTSSDQPDCGYVPTDYYAVPDQPGTWGKYKPYPSQGYPCGHDAVDNSTANRWSTVLVPRCVEYVAGMIKLYYDTCNGD